MKNIININQWTELIARETGLLISDQNSVDFQEGLRRRMKETGIREEAVYLKLTRDNPQELQKLASSLTVQETYFFREPAQIKLLTGKLLPALLAGKKDNEPVSILCAGCATGAEPYSIAIMMAQDWGESFPGRLNIWGIDIDEDALAQARLAVYGRHQFREGGPDLKNRYFTPVAGERFALRDQIKRQVTFINQNLAARDFPPELQRLDVIFYRNVSIYFNEEKQKTIFTRLAGLLNPGGYLFMSAPEIMAHDFGVLQLIEQDGVFYFSRREQGAARGREQTLHPKVKPTGENRPELKKTLAGSQLRRASAGPDSKAVPKMARASVIPGSPPPDVDELFFQAGALAESKAHEQALNIIDQIISIKPADVRYWTFKAGLLMNLNRLAEAQDLCSRATQRDPLWLEGHYLAGIIAMHAGRTDEALEQFRKTVYLDACCWPAHFYLGELERQRGEKVRAIQAFRRALQCLGQPAALQPTSLFMRVHFPVEEIIGMCQRQIDKLSSRG